MNIHHNALNDQLAAEYVLGTLQGAARQRFEHLLPAHPNLQRAVSQWEARLSPLVMNHPPKQPPSQVWHNLEKRLFPAKPRQSWWENLTLWHSMAAAGLLIAVIILAPRLVVPTQQGMPFAAIRDQKQNVLWTVAAADSDHLRVNSLQAVEMPPDQRCFLWLKTREKPAILLGILPDDGSSVRTLTVPTGTSEPTQGKLWVTMQATTSNPNPPTHPLYKTHWQAL